MGARLQYSVRSRSDLSAIWHYISDDSSRSAEAVLGRLHAKIETLREHPDMGHPRNDIHRGSRCVNCDGYMILYRHSAGLVRIDRIVHHSRDLENLTYDES